MTILALLLAIAAVFCFGVAAANSRSVGDGTKSVALVPLGLALLTLALICQFLGLTEPVNV